MVIEMIKDEDVAELNSGEKIQKVVRDVVKSAVKLVQDEGMSGVDAIEEAKRRRIDALQDRCESLRDAMADIGGETNDGVVAGLREKFETIQAQIESTKALLQGVSVVDLENYAQSFREEAPKPKTLKR